jgi:hypothetical protein
MKYVFWASGVAMCAHTFVWPLAISWSPDQPAFKAAAIATLIVFFASMLALLAQRMHEKD